VVGCSNDAGRCEEVEEVSVTAAIRGYEIEATATPQEFRWLAGDGAGYVSSHPGTEDDPSAVGVLYQYTVENSLP